MPNFEDQGYVIAAVSALYLNGYLDADKGKCSLRDFAQFLAKYGYLTTAQLAIVRVKLRAYEHILASMDIKAEEIPSVKETGGGKPKFSIYNPKTIRIDTKSPALVQRMRKIAGFRKCEDGVYLMPFSRRNAWILRLADFEMDARVEEFLRREKPLPEPDFSDILRPLKEYQKAGVAFLLANESGSILADDCGLGKTGQAIVWAHLSGFKRVCIVCPASLKANWKREIGLWVNTGPSVILAGRTANKADFEAIETSRWIIINYDILPHWLDTLNAANFDAIIFDEAQALKDPKSKRSVAATHLAKGTRCLLLSGTPCENRPAELYPLINIADPLLFQSKTWFYRRYCNLHRSHLGFMDYSGASNTEELHECLYDTVMIRRKKEDVLQELPEKQRSVIPVDIPAKALREYRSAERDFEAWLEKHSTKKGAAREKQFRAQALIRVGVLKQMVARAKLDMAIEWIKLYLESEPKLVVFAVHKDVIARLEKEFKHECVVIDGSVATDKRQELCDRFQYNPRVRLFIGNIKAAGTGLTLTAAKDSMTLELAWTSTAHDQAEDRVHRIGQRNAVTAYYMIAQGTIEDRIMAILENKREMVSQIMEGAASETDAVLDMLLDNMQGGEK